MNKYPITPTLSTDDNTPTAVFKQFCFDIANSSAWDYRFQTISINPLVSIYQISNISDDDSNLLDELQAVLYEFNNDSLNRIFQYLHPMIDELQMSVNYSFSTEWNGVEYEDVAGDTTDELMERLNAVTYIVGSLQFKHSAGLESFSTFSKNLSKLV